MIVKSVAELTSNPIFYALEDFVKSPIFLKVECLNISRSIKHKTANYLLSYHEKHNHISPTKNKLICSTSGNLGIALSIMCKEKGYDLLCVVDANTNPQAIEIMDLYGAKVKVISELDENGGYLGSRLKYIRELQKDDKNLVWINQYEGIENTEAHYITTAQEISNEFPDLDYLFIGASTTGTLMGCAKYFKEYSPNTKIVAVDAVGSVIFSDTPGKRRIPGLGASHRPSIVDKQYVDDVVWVEELDTVRTCHYVLKKYGLCVGGSTGTVLSAIRQKCSNLQGKIVAISPDFGEPYRNSIYSSNWLEKNGFAEVNSL